jgi:hypothetical protein
MVLVRIASALLGAIVGLQLIYWATASIACGLLWPQSNICGLPAVFLAAPFGVVAGLAAAFLVGYRFAPDLAAFASRDSRARTMLAFALAVMTSLWTVGIPEWRGESFRLTYWLVTIPSLCMVSAGLGYWIPRHAWRWGVAPLLGQWLWEILVEGSQIGSGNLGPFAHVVVFVSYALAAIPCIIAAEIGARQAARSNDNAAPSERS